MNWPTKLALITVAMIAVAQPPTNDPAGGRQTQVPRYWIDPATGLMWAGRDNGKDVNWHQAVRYCRALRLAGYSDWRLATLAELQGIYDKNSHAYGLAGPGKGSAFPWHVKGNLFLTGDEWSSTHILDDRGHPIGLTWYFDFNEGRQFQDDADRITGFNARYNKHALCVRPSGQ